MKPTLPSPLLSGGRSPLFSGSRRTRAAFTLLPFAAMLAVALGGALYRSSRQPHSHVQTRDGAPPGNSAPPRSGMPPRAGGFLPGNVPLHPSPSVPTPARDAVNGTPHNGTPRLDVTGLASYDTALQAAHEATLPAGIPDLRAIARAPGARTAYYTARTRLEERERQRALKAAAAWAQLKRDQMVSRRGRLFPTASGQIEYQIKQVRNGENDDAQTRRTMSVRWLDYGKQFRFDRIAVSGPAHEQLWHTWIMGDRSRLFVMRSGSGPGGLDPMSQPFVLQTSRPADLRSSIGRLLWFLPPAGMERAHHLGSGQILGRSCAIYTLTEQDSERGYESKLWLWRGIVLRAEITLQFWGSVPTAMSGGAATTRRSITATRLTPARPAASWFEVPSGYSIEKVGIEQLTLR